MYNMYCESSKIKLTVHNIHVHFTNVHVFEVNDWLIIADTGFTKPSSPGWRIHGYMMSHCISLLYHLSMTLIDWVRCSHLLG